MRAFAFLSKFIVVKILKQEVDDNLSIRVDERSPYGLSICFNDVTAPNGEMPCGFLSNSCFYCPNLITGAPVIRDKKFR